MEVEFRERTVAGYILRTASDVDKLVNQIRPSAVICMGHVGNLSHWWLALKKKRLGYALISWQRGYEYHPGVLKGALLNRFVPRFEHHLAYHSNARAYALKHGARSDRRQWSTTRSTRSRSPCCHTRRREPACWPGIRRLGIEGLCCSSARCCSRSGWR